MQDTATGEALNYGQSKKGKFRDFQYNTYGVPRRERTAPGGDPNGQQGGGGQPQGPAPDVMPTGMPTAGGSMMQQQSAPSLMDGPQPAMGMPMNHGNMAPQPYGPQQSDGAQSYGGPAMAGNRMSAPSQVQYDPRGTYQAPPPPQGSIYQAQHINQFQAPQNSAMQGQVEGLVGQILQHPESMGVDVVNQMKGQTRDQAALMQQQTMGQLQQNLAGRGIAGDYGYGAGQQRQVMSDTNRGVLDNYRNLDIQAAQTNRADQMNAAGLGQNYLNNQFSQGLQGYQAGLQGQQLQGQENQNAANSQLQNWQAQQGAQQSQQQSIMQAIQMAIGQGQFGQQMGLQQRQFGEGQRQFNQGYDLQNRQFGEGQRQFDQNFGFQNKQFDANNANQQAQLGLQGASLNQAGNQFDQQMAFQYQQAQQQQMQNLLAALMGGG